MFPAFLPKLWLARPVAPWYRIVRKRSALLVLLSHVENVTVAEKPFGLDKSSDDSFCFKCGEVLLLGRRWRHVGISNPVVVIGG